MGDIIDGIAVPHNFKNIKGYRFGRLVVKTLKRNSKNKLIWECVCDCGNTRVSRHSDINNGDVNSCGCLQNDLARKRGTHNMSSTPEYKAWKRIKGRVCNPKERSYSTYSKLGMEELWKTSFEAFFLEIGEVPKGDCRYSVDRIDNNIGYFTGNVRWATDAEQAKNKSRYSSNKSGVNGVYFANGSGGRSYYAATYYLDGRQKTKYFSVKKYGEELAFFMACEYREQQINLLNLQGAGYTEGHGKVKSTMGATV